MQLVVNMGRHPLMAFEVDFAAKTARPLLDYPGLRPEGALARLLFPEEKRTFVGLEQLLNELYATKLSAPRLSLEELLQQVGPGRMFTAKEPHLSLSFEAEAQGELRFDKLTRQGHTLTLAPGYTFGDNGLKGNQHKDVLEIAGVPHMIKRDNVNPESGIGWKNDNYDFAYASVAETIVSIFAQHLAPREDFVSARYDFVVLDDQFTQQSASASPLFTSPSQSDFVLTDARGLDRKVLISLEEFGDNLVDKKPRERFFDLVKLFAGFDGIDEAQAASFLAHQVAFDIVTLNQDRHENPGNIGLVIDELTDQAQLINYDFGRCLPTPTNLWTEQYEANYTDDMLAEDLADYAKDRTLAQANHSLLNGLTFEESLAFIKEQGFQPFELDRTGFDQAAQALLETINQTNLPIKTFAKAKLARFQTILDSDWAQQLVRSV